MRAGEEVPYFIFLYLLFEMYFIVGRFVTLKFALLRCVGMHVHVLKFKLFHFSLVFWPVM